MKGETLEWADATHEEVMEQSKKASETLDRINDKIKSLQQTIDLQMEVIEQLQEENGKLIKEVFRLKAKKKKGEKR